LNKKTLARAVVAAKRLKYLRKASMDATGFLHPSVRQAMKNSCKISCSLQGTTRFGEECGADEIE